MLTHNKKRPIIGERSVIMTELEIIAHAQTYLEKLAKGINPLTGEEVGENDVINNVRISRCLFYTADLLKKIVDNKGKFKVGCPREHLLRLHPNSSHGLNMPNTVYQSRSLPSESMP